MTSPHFSRLARAGVVTAIVDGLFSSVLSVAFYRSTVTRLFQGVASVLVGPSALDGGTRPAAIGVLMHVGVAFGPPRTSTQLWKPPGIPVATCRSKWFHTSFNAAATR